MKKLLLVILTLGFVTACGTETFEHVEVEFEDFTEVSESQIQTNVSELIHINNEYISSNNVNGYLANRTNDSKVSEELEAEFESYDFSYDVESIEIVEVTEDAVTVVVVQKELFDNVSEDIDVVDSLVTIEYVFELNENNNLTISNETILESLPLTLIEEVEELIHLNIEAAHEKDVEKYMGTLAEVTEDFTNTIEEQFNLFDIEYNILELEILEFSDEEVIVEVHQENIFHYVHEDWEAYDSIAIAHHTLTRQDGELKFYYTEIIDSQPLD
ncbi:hypothetical protein QA612_21390 [Evansella sp. AB-P1]|uniref:hypothetical protein n=1 Tax=Evansella sp. AB-P1 TaxID=3037653 RepID=UPI00241F4645|nr:hypothetical protein [Evansella sp. AB-P1]MDG5790014.1 hypothetical protein [Evansella sp. AB-P1]